MDWLFIKDAAGWPEHLVYAIEIGFVLATSVLVGLDIANRGGFAVPAALFCGVAVAYPFALAPLFFGVSGEWMLATLPASPVVLGVAFFVSLKFIQMIDG